MFSQLKKAICKARRNPRYLWYFFLNVNVVRDHFPSLYREMQRRKALDLGGPSELSRVHVILRRTTDFVMNLNASRHLEDVGIKTRNDVIRMGGCSLFPAAAKFATTYGKENIRISLVVDRLSNVGLRQYREAADARRSLGKGNLPRTAWLDSGGTSSQERSVAGADIATAGGVDGLSC